MVWRTALACAPRTQTNCTVVNGGQHYNLGLLTRYSENYKIHAENKELSKIVLNVCHSVIRQHGALCPTKTGICLEEPKKPNK